MKKTTQDFQILMKTVVILLVYTLIWQVVELLIDGYITQRNVDTIMIFLFSPCICCTVKMISEKRQTYHKETTTHITVNPNLFDGVILVDSFEDGYKTYNIIAVKISQSRPVQTVLVKKYYDLDAAKMAFNIISKELNDRK